MQFAELQKQMIAAMKAKDKVRKEIGRASCRERV